LFRAHLHELQPDERRLHETMRSYTTSIAHAYHERALQLIEREPRLGIFLPSWLALKQYLRAWLASYVERFASTPALCLLEVGRAEQAHYPSQIAAELAYYVTVGAPSPRIKRLEEPGEYEGETYEAFRQRQLARMRAIERRITEVTRSETLEEIYGSRREALGLLPTSEAAWLPHVEALSRRVDAALVPHAPSALIEAGSALRRAIFAEHASAHNKLSHALPWLMALRAHEQALGLGSTVSVVWNALRALLQMFDNTNEG
jgi:hypothetical protein